MSLSLLMLYSALFTLFVHADLSADAISLSNTAYILPGTLTKPAWTSGSVDVRQRYLITARDVTTVVATQTIATSTVAYPSTSSYNPLVSTITGNVANLNPSLVGSSPVTVLFTNVALLTGTCTIPYFATYSSPNLGVIEYPQIGCSEGYENCCPVNFHENVVFTQCPVGYSTVQARNTSGCCPSGWRVYGFSFGSQYPCYTILSTTLVPATTPTVSDLTVVTGKLFARQFLLNPPPVTSHTSPSPQPIRESGHHSKLVEIVVSIVLSLTVLLGTCILLWCLRQRRRAKSDQTTTSAQEDGTFNVIRNEHNLPKYQEHQELPAEPPGHKEPVYELGSDGSQEVKVAAHEHSMNHANKPSPGSPIVSPFSPMATQGSDRANF